MINYVLEAPATLSNALQTEANAGTAWNDVSYVRANYGLTGAGQTVAVIDTGIAWDHQSLGNGYGAGSRIVGGWDFAENDANPYDDGPSGFHGTHVAGIIGAQDAGYPGVASGVDFVALRVFDDQGAGNFGWVEKALQWVSVHKNDYANPITTINLSIGTAWNSNAPPNWANLEDEFLALKNAGIVITVSAGNSFTSYNAAGLSYPAASPYVIPVASVGASGNLSSFSQRNSRVLAAPGENITSTVPDYLYSNDGVKNDFAAASGTSMAAPFMAGACVLVRQAMQQAGYTSINEDTIYNTLRSTADSVFDSVTNASYLRVNLRRAIDTVLQSDDFGGTANTAFSLGTVGEPASSVSGRIGSSGDLDAFSFVAGSTGVARFTVAAGSPISPTWQLIGGASGSGSGSTFEFNVVAGQTYSVAIGSSGASGSYTLNATVTPTDWGNVSFYYSGNHQATGDQWFTMTASRTGLFSAEAIFANAGGNVDIQVYNASNQLLGSSATTNDGERVDLNVTAGQQLSVRIIGTNANVAYRCTNLVSASGDTITLGGSIGSDLFVFLPGASVSRIAVNGVGYDFANSVFRNFRVEDPGAVDTLVVVGTNASEAATFIVGNLQINSSDYTFTAIGAENAYLYANGGNDTATFNDSTGNDTFVGSPGFGSMTGIGFTHAAYGVETASAVFSTGYDQAFLYGSIGDDRLEASSATGSLYSSGYRLNASGYDTLVGVGGAGYDLAQLADTNGTDYFIGDANGGSLSNANYFLLASNFDRVEARSTGGGDVATLTGSTGDDALGASKVLAYLNGAGFSNYVEGFTTVKAYGNGGNDTGLLYDSAGNDRLTVSLRSRLLEGTGYSVRLENFAIARAYASGGADSILLQQLTAKETVTGRSNWLSLLSSTSGDSLLTYGFEQVNAAAKTGQKPKADVQAVDYLFTKSGF